jgi:Serine hydrolase (FSH1)
VLALHGFGSGNPRIDSYMLFAAQCFDHGMDVALLTLPSHGARTPPNATFSGERFGMPHGAAVNEVVRQAVYGIHMVSGWLRQQTGMPVGLLGMSLGGYLSALMAGLTDEWAFVIPMVPPVCMGDLAARFYSRSRHYGAGNPPPFSREQLRAAYRVHSPLTYPLRIDQDRVLILAARGDQFVPAEHPQALWQHWDKPEIYWFTGSHTVPIQRGRVVARVLAHMDRCLGRPQRPA